MSSSQSDLSVSAAIDHIFQLSPSPQSDVLFESVFHLCHAILRGYSQCSIWRTYQSYFEKKEKNVERMTRSDPEEQPAKKRTRRGKRGGKHLTAQRSRKSPKYDPPQAKDNPPKQSAQLAPTLTVGERLLSHTLRNGLLDITLTQDGYESQEDQGAANTESPVKKKRKRKRVDAQDKQSLDSSESPHQNLRTANGPGLQYSLDLRTMRTEVSSLSLLS
jgi:hypothetical protein